MSLRKLTENDLALVLTWRNNPEVRRFMYNSHEISEDEHREWFARMEQDHKSLWYIHEDKKGNPDGVIYFVQYSPENQSSFWGFYAASNASRGAGAIMEFEALDFIFNVFGLHKLNCEVLSNNSRAIRLHKKFGFIEEGSFRDYLFNGVDFVDVIRFGILKSEWLEKRSDIEKRIAKLDAIAKTISSGGGLKIMLLTDHMSWINPWVDDLVEEWQVAGHECIVAHKVDDAISADFCFCLSFGQLVTADVRAKYRHTLVVHESDLPKGRGWSPMSWQILEGQNHIPITLFEAVDKVDAGGVYLQEWIDLNGSELSAEWRKLQAEATLGLCRDFISTYPGLINKVQTQVGKPTFYPRRSSEDSQLDPDKTLTEQFDLLRIVDNEQYPAYMEIRGKKFLLTIEPFQ